MKRSEKEIWDNINEIKWEIERELWMERDQQIAIMQSPEHWKFPNFLPLIRIRGDTKELGFLYYDQGALLPLMPTVYLGCIFDLAAAKRSIGMLLTREQVQNCTSLHYVTFRSLCFAGWEIDD